MSSPAVSPGSSSSKSRALGWLAGGALLLGGALAIIASFLPFGRVSWSAIAGDPPGSITDIPANDVLYWLVRIPQALRGQVAMSVGGALFAAFILWGAPALLAALGAGALLARRWKPTARVFVPALILAALEVALTLIARLSYLHPFFGSQGATRMLLYGADVTLAGYLLALVGSALLPFLPRPARRRP